MSFLIAVVGMIPRAISWTASRYSHSRSYCSIQLLPKCYVHGCRWRPSQLPEGILRPYAQRCFSANTDFNNESHEPNHALFRKGDKIQVEVISFGPLGASIHVVGKGHDEADLIPESAPPLGQGLILQKEIRYFREARGKVDVVRGELLLAYVESVRDDGKINVGLRTFGGKAKADEVGALILNRLAEEESGLLPLGDKSSPKDINAIFPGVSKGSFKKAVSSLYKQGKVKPGPDSISLLR